MRILAGTLIITVFIFIFSFYSVSLLENESFQLVELLKEVEEVVREENWEKAQLNMNAFIKEWEKKHATWGVLLEHSEMDNIDLHLAYLKAFMDTNNLSNSLAEINALLKYLKHIPDIEKLTIENIL